MRKEKQPQHADTKWLTADERRAKMLRIQVWKRCKKFVERKINYEKSMSAHAPMYRPRVS
jgi:hypothetical protein